MKTVKLYGHLGKQFGKVHIYDVRTPVEAIRALKANFKGFESALLDNKYAGYKIIIGNEDRSTTEQLYYPADDTIKIIPVVAGAGGDGGSIGMIIVGVVLVAAAIITQQYYVLPAIAEATAAGTTVATAVTVAGYAATAAMVVGASLVMTGVSNLLYSPNTPASRDAEEQITSTYFNGAVNLTTQGNPVPLAYGKIRVGSQVVSAGLLTYKV